MTSPAIEAALANLETAAAELGKAAYEAAAADAADGEKTAEFRSHRPPMAMT